MRPAEKLYQRHGGERFQNRFRIAKQAKCNKVTAAKCNYYKTKIDDCKDDSTKLYRVLNSLLGKTAGDKCLPSRTNDMQLANEFSNYFLQKVKNISESFMSVQSSKSQLIPDFPILTLSNFIKLNDDQVLRTLRKISKTNCANDPFNIRKVCFKTILPSLASIFSDIV